MNTAITAAYLLLLAALHWKAIDAVAPREIGAPWFLVRVLLSLVFLAFCAIFTGAALGVIATEFLP